MASPLIVDKVQRKIGSLRFGAELLGLLGIAIVILGLSETVMAFIPLGVGNREWEFATAITILDQMPVVVLGLGFALFWLLFQQSARAARGLAVFSIVLGAVVFLLVVVALARSIGPALAAPTDSLIRLGVQKAVGKAVLQAVLIPLTLIWLGRTAMAQPGNLPPA
jgi:hypothetical protein